MSPPPSIAPGTLGIVSSELRPFGRVTIDSTVYDAQAEHGSIAVGQTVEVVRTTPKGLLVRGHTL